MEEEVVIAVVVAAVVVILLLAAVVLMRQRQRRAMLQERFGPEYERTVGEAGSRRDAERELVERQKEREVLDIRTLPPQARERYSADWHETQARFVDTPGEAVRDADRLVARVMRERGYPIEERDFEGRAKLVSVDHAGVVDEYREAHAIAVSEERGEATTEDLRRAMVHYRSLFERLLEVREAPGRT